MQRQPGALVRLTDLEVALAAAMAFAFAPVGHLEVSLLRRGWGRLSGGKQYLVASTSFFAVVMSPFALGCYLLSGYLGTSGYLAGALLLPIQMLLFPRRTERGEDNIFQRFQFKHFTVRMLWRDSRTRTCKRCGYYDASTRELGSKPGVMQSIEDPCPACGGKDFEFHMLDYEPLP
jgi:hypothetical protein